MDKQLAQFMKSKGLTPARLAQQINVQPSSISHIISGGNKPSFDFIYKLISAFPDLNPEWLITGRGNMNKEYTQQSGPGLFDDNDLKQQPENERNKELSSSKENIPDHETESDQIFHSEADKKAVSGNKKIERVVLFYTDQTFEEYRPSSW